MIEQPKGGLYRAFGFRIASDIPLPELCASRHDSRADLTIRRGDLTALWHELAGGQDETRFVVQDRMVFFRIRQTAIFGVKNGNDIIVSPMPGADADKIRLYILGTCMGALLMQRGVLPLHGSAMAVNGHAYAFVGHSGVGKSTLASILLRRGYRLLSDDVIAVSSQNGSIPYVVPSYPQQKLWRDSIRQLGMDHQKYKPLFERENKFSVPVERQYCDESLPLAGIFELVKTKEGRIRIDPIRGLERLKTLFRHTYRHFLLPRLGLLEWHFHVSVGISRHTEFYTIERPAGVFTGEEIASLIINQLEEGQYVQEANPYKRFDYRAAAREHRE